MSPRRRLLAELALIAALVVFGAFVQHARLGIDMPYLALVFTLLAPSYHRWLAFRGEIAPSRLTLPLELASFLGLVEYPLPDWALGFASAAALWSAFSALRSEPGAKASVLDRALLALVTVPTLVAVIAVSVGDPNGWIQIVAVIVATILGRAFAPGAEPRARECAVSAGALAAIGQGAFLALHFGWFSRLGPATILGLTLSVLAGRQVSVADGAARSAVRLAFWMAVAGCLGMFVLSPILPSHVVRLPFEIASRSVVDDHECHALFGPPVLDYSTSSIVLEDGRALPYPDAPLGEIAALGSGRYLVIGPHVAWSASDNTNPLANGKRYELEARCPFNVSPLGGLAIAGTIALCFMVWRLGVFDLTSASSRQSRALAVLALVAGLGAGLWRTWDRVFVSFDSSSYVDHSTIRPLLYPLWLDAFDRRPGEPRVVVADSSVHGHDEPDGRFVNGVRAQKILTVLGLAVLVWTLSAWIPLPILAVMTYWSIMNDLGQVGHGSIAFNMGCLMSEGVNHGLIFLFLASVVAYFERPTWPRGVAIALVLVLLNLNRPANSSLAAVFAFVWVLHASGSGWRSATVRTAVLASVFLAPILLVCAENKQRTGHFALHSFTGFNTVCVALQVATPDDEEAFEDPTIRRFVHACVVENAGIKIPDYTTESGPNCLNTNLYLNASSAWARTMSFPPGEPPGYYQNGVFTEVTRRILPRHKLAYARIVLTNVRAVWSWSLHGGALLCALVAAYRYRRTRQGLYLLATFSALLPLIALAPACLVSFPLDRYRAQLGFLEPLALPFLAVTIARLEPAVFGRFSSDTIR